MSALVSHIIGVSIVCLTVGSGADQRKHESSASLAFVEGIHRWPVNSRHKRPVTRKMFPFDDDIILFSQHLQYPNASKHQVLRSHSVVSTDQGLCHWHAWNTSVFYLGLNHCSAIERIAFILHTVGRRYARDNGSVVRINEWKSPKIKPNFQATYDNDIKALHYWLFAREIHRWPVNSPRQGQVMQKTLRLVDSKQLSIASPCFNTTVDKVSIDLSGAETGIFLQN